MRISIRAREYELWNSIICVNKVDIIIVISKLFCNSDYLTIMNELLVFDNHESVTITVKASTGFFLEVSWTLYSWDGC